MVETLFTLNAPEQSEGAFRVNRVDIMLIYPKEMFIR